MSNWISVYKKTPEHGQVVNSRISGEQGYCGGSEWDSYSSTFRTYTNHRNRYEITIWKHDEWMPSEERPDD
mgnify:CR=1 FL=1